MTHNTIRCCILGGQEKDLYALGELHKQPGVEIAYVYDKDLNAVGLEIAEILGIPRTSRREELAGFDAVEYVVVTEPRGAFEDELVELSATGAKVVSQSEAMSMFGSARSKSAEPEKPEDEAELYSVEDELEHIIEAFPLDEVLKECSRIDIIKMDIEGAEGRAWMGMKEIVQRFKPEIILE